MSSNQKLDALHPQKEVILSLWDIFLENVNPLIKVIHVPSFRKIIDMVCVPPFQISKSNEALLFAIYFATVSSMSDKECMQIMKTPKKTAVHKYRIAAQQALVNAAFLRSNNLVTLQAFSTFLVSVRNDTVTNADYYRSVLARYTIRAPLCVSPASVFVLPVELDFIGMEYSWGYLHLRLK
jgi:hypothetical protein